MQMHVGFVRQAVRLTLVARLAGTDCVAPRVPPTAAHRQDVVNREILTIIDPPIVSLSNLYAAICAREVIAAQTVQSESQRKLISITG